MHRCTAKSSYYNADNHVIRLSCGCGRNESLHTSVPISHLLNSPLILFFNIRDEKNCDISNILKYLIRGSLFLISVSAERSGKWWTRSGVIIKCSERVRGELLLLHAAHILCLTPPHKCGFLLNDCPSTGFNTGNSSIPVTKDTVTVCQAILDFLSINLSNYPLTMFWPAI